MTVTVLAVPAVGAEDAGTGGRPLGLQLFDDGDLLVGFHLVTGVREHHGKVWMGSLHEPSVAVHDLA